jgi:ATP-dependent Lhr-like helicase
VEENFASQLSPGDTFFFAGLTLEVERMEVTDLIVRATKRSARIPTYLGQRLPISTSLADRVRRFLHEPAEWPRFPADVRDWLEIQGRARRFPRPGNCSSRPSRMRAATTWSPTASKAGTRTSRSAC